MEQKKIETTLVAAHSFSTSMLTIHEAVGVKPDMIRDELAKQRIEPTSPQIWNYRGCDGKPDTVFELDICIPVKEKGKDTSQIKFTNLNEFKCVNYIHNGAWSEFEQVYGKLFADIAEKGIIPNGVFREVYLHCDFEDQSKCITEIQIGIQ